MFPLNPEHEIVRKYLECGSWKETGIHQQIGKHAVFKVLQYHLNHCVFEANSEHKIVAKYLESRSWNGAGIHSQEGKNAVQKVLRFHMVHCIHIILEPTKTINQKVLWKCPNCGKEISVTHYEAKRRKYCSHECWAKNRRRKRVSDKRAFRCSREWAQIRKQRVSDFGHICPITLKSEKIDSLEVHHIDSDYTNNEPENLIPLWTPLHRLITARAEVSRFYAALDTAILLSITQAWR
jgi:hypothetical protein